MTIEQAVVRLDAISGTDPEDAHYQCDQILLQFAPPEVLAARDRLLERADGWWYA